MITFLLSLLIGCAPKAADVIVLEVGPSTVSLKEYEDFYTRNSGGWDAARQSSAEERERFLELLTNYKLKLLDAYDRNLMNDTDIIRELQEYRTSLASTYMLDRELTEPGVRKLYDRKKEEIRSRHILLSLRVEASPDETLKVYNQALDLIARIRAGENIDTLALRFSGDPSAKTMGAENYYFTAGQMPTVYEDAAYGMHAGDLTPVPVRSQFGYYIIKVVDRKPVLGKIKVRHLMTLFKSMNPDSAEDAGAHARILTLQDSLKKGWDFAKLAVKLSEDAGSASQGGELGGWFERRRWVLPFDEACFKLNAGGVSGVVRSPLGYHIIKCDSVQSLASFKDLKEELRKLYQQQRYGEQYSVYIGVAKKEFHYSFDEDVFSSVVAGFDSTNSVGDSAWDGGVTAELRKLALMKIAGKPVSVDSVLQAVAKRPDFRNTLLRRSDIRPKIDRIGETFVLGEKSAELERRYPEFAALMKEYNDGVVLYKAEQLEVWNKSVVTDSALKKFYAENQAKFRFPEKVNLAEIDVVSDTLAALIYDSLSRGADMSKLSSRHNIDEDLKAKGGVRGMLPADTDEITKLSIGMEIGQLSEPIEIGNGSYTIIKILGREPAREKTFEEAGAEVSNLYQDQLTKNLEKEWLDRLKQKYPVRQFKERLRDAFAAPVASH